MSDQIRDFCDIAILKASYGINIGQTIYVRWIIGTECINGDNSVESEEIVWWPGKILMTEKEERDSKGRRVYMLNYEEKDEFKSDHTRVVFETKERIIHLDYDKISLRFCKNKDEIQNIKENYQVLHNGETIEDFEDDKTITIQEILEGDIFGFSGSDESETGEMGEFTTRSTGNSGFASIFNSLPHEKKIHLAQGYREFADKFISFLKNKMNNDQNKNTITIDDIRDFIAFLGLNNNNNINNNNPSNGE